MKKKLSSLLLFLAWYLSQLLLLIGECSLKFKYHKTLITNHWFYESLYFTHQCYFWLRLCDSYCGRFLGDSKSWHGWLMTERFTDTCTVCDAFCYAWSDQSTDYFRIGKTNDLTWLLYELPLNTFPLWFRVKRRV